jgi:hypothetical protein
VRKPMGRIIIVLISLGLAARFFDAAMSKNKYWGFWAGITAMVGVLFFLDLVWSRTTFAMDLLEQRSFAGIIRRLRYVDIEKAKLVYAGHGIALRLLSIDGKKINVYGNRKEIIKAQELLFEKIPNAFEKWGPTD